MPGFAPILVAEDEETDVMMLRLAARHVNLPHPLVVVQDGMQAIAYLSGEPPYADRSQHPLPCLILLDLKMPLLTGFDVLAWVSGRRDLKHLPVVVLSSSGQDADVAKARQLGAREYHIKPHSFIRLASLLKELCSRLVEDLKS